MNTNSFYKTIINSLHEAFVLTDDSGEILFYSDNCERILPLTQSVLTSITNVSQLNKSLQVDSSILNRLNKILVQQIKITNTPNRANRFSVTVSRLETIKNLRLYSFRPDSPRDKQEDLLHKKIIDLEISLQKKTKEVERKNIALTEVLNHIEQEKQKFSGRVDANVQKLLLPIIDKLIEKASSFDSRYLQLVKQNLEELTSSLGIKLSSVKYRLTPKEIEFCTLIKGGFTIKEIAVMQSLSERTVETHRFNIRKKLGITSSRINLATYLAQL